MNKMPGVNPYQSIQSFNKAKCERLRKAHKSAVKDGRNEFVFEGAEYVTRFAGYLLEFLDMKMGKISQ